jgi:hypothetical protein
MASPAGSETEAMDSPGQGSGAAAMAEPDVSEADAMASPAGSTSCHNGPLPAGSLADPAMASQAVSKS